MQSNKMKRIREILCSNILPVYCTRVRKYLALERSDRWNGEEGSTVQYVDTCNGATRVHCKLQYMHALSLERVDAARVTVIALFIIDK